MQSISHDYHNSLSLLQHDFKENSRQVEKQIMYKVCQVSKTQKVQKQRVHQKALMQNEIMHQDIFNTIVNKLNSNKIRIYDLYKLMKEYGFTINYETIDSIYHLCDLDKDYAFDYQEYLGMIKNGQANKIYATFAKTQVQEKLRIAKRKIRQINRIDDKADPALLNGVIPMTLQGFFFHVAHQICRTDLYEFASDAQNLVGERFEAMFNLLKYNQKNNILQSGEDNYDEELKQKYLHKSNESKNTMLNMLDDIPLLSSTRILKNENSISRFSSSANLINENASFHNSSLSHLPISQIFGHLPPSQNRRYPEKETPHNQDVEELDQLVKMAKNQGQSEAITEYYQSSILEPQDLYIHSLPLGVARSKQRYNLHLPTLPHSFGDHKGIIRKQYVLPSYGQKFGQKNKEHPEARDGDSNLDQIPQNVLEKFGLNLPINLNEQVKFFKDQKSLNEQKYLRDQKSLIEQRPFFDFNKSQRAYEEGRSSFHLQNKEFDSSQNNSLQRQFEGKSKSSNKINATLEYQKLLFREKPHLFNDELMQQSSLQSIPVTKSQQKLKINQRRNLYSQTTDNE